MRKGCDGGEPGKKETGGGKIKTFLVATYAVASQPPECRPTGMPCARAKSQKNSNQYVHAFKRNNLFHSGGGGGIRDRVKEEIFYLI